MTNAYLLKAQGDGTLAFRGKKKKVSIRNISHGDKSIKPVSVRLGSE